MLRGKVLALFHATLGDSLARRSGEASAFRPQAREVGWRIAFVYVVFAVLWSLFSNRLYVAVSDSPETLRFLDIFEDMVFVAVTALLLYYFVRYAFARIGVAVAGLEQSEARFRALFDETSDAIFVAQRDSGAILDANPQAATLTGRPVESLRGMRLSELYAHEEAQAAMLEIYAMARSPGSRTVRQNVRRSDGRSVPVEISAAVGEVPGGERLLFSIFRDMSERKRAEQSLRESERRYRVLFDSNPHPMWVYDLETLSFLAVNDAAVRHYGYPLEEFLGMTVADILPPGEGSRVLENVGAARRRRGPDETGAWRHVTKDGSEILVEIGSHTLDWEGRPAEVVLAYDVTEARKAESALRESELRLRLALRAGKQGLYDLNVQTGEVLVNDEYAEMLGYDPARFYPTVARWRGALHPEDRDRVLELYDSCISGSIPDCRTEFRLRMAGGAWKWILAMGAVVERDAQGRALRMVGTHTDISQDKAAEERILKLSRLYATLSHANQAIVRARSEADLLLEVCRVAVDHGNFRMASFGFVEGRSVKIVARQGDATGYLDQINLSVDPEVPEGRGPTGTALREGRSYVCEDFLSDPATIPWHDAARAAGFRSSAAVPVARSGRSSGVVTFYATEPGYFDPEIVSLIEALAANLSHGLDALNTARERESAMERLRAANDRLTAVFEASPLPIVTLDPEGIVTDWNRAAQRVFGWTAAEAIGRPPPFVPPESAEESAALIGRSARGESFSGVEFRRRRKNGAEIEISLYTAPLYDVAGRLYALIAIYADITERKRMEAELRRVAAERQQLDLIFNRSPAIAFTVRVEPGLPIEFVSRNVNQYGYTAEELMRGPARFASVVHPDDLEFATTGTASFIAEGRSEYSHEFRMLTRAGDPRWTDVRGWIERDGDGRAVRITGVLLDITARKLAEQELARTKTELQQLSIQLLEAQERERQALSRELHDELGQGLTAVKLHLQRIMRHRDASGFAERLEECVRITDGALQQVRGLSLWLRPPQLDDLGLEAALRWQVSHMAEAGGLEVRFMADPDMPRLSPEIEVACFRVAQEAMTNVVRHANARHLDVELRRREGELEVRVRDDGCGFDESARRREPGRASVGLVGMHERVALVRGSLEFHSRPGAGTEVVAIFPVRLRDESGASRQTR